MAKFMICVDGMEERGAPPPAVPREGLCACGTVRTVPAGGTADSLGCILRLLGVSEAEIPQGRAALEALAVGLPLEPGDAVLRGTLCTVDADGRLAAPAHGEVPAWFDRLTPLLPEGWTLTPMSGYRCLLRVPNGERELTELVTLPPHQHFGERAADCLPYGGELGAALAALARESAKLLPGRMLLPWGQSAPQGMRSFQARTGMPAAMVCHAEIARGIALGLGMGCPPIAGATADVDTDLAAKCCAALELAKDHALVVVHVNGCDEAGHRRNSAEKAAFLRKIFAELLGPLRKSLEEGDRLLLCSDHRTSSVSGAHEDERVHFWLYGRDAEPPKEDTFDDAGAPLRLLLGREGG